MIATQKYTINMITDPFSDGGFSKKVNKSELLYFYFQIGYLRYKRTKETSSGNILISWKPTIK